MAIARALARKPEILIFDDSFSALDYKTDRILRQALKEELADTTKLIVAQRISTIMDADLILVLDQGKVVGQGTHKELLAPMKSIKKLPIHNCLRRSWNMHKTKQDSSLWRQLSPYLKGFHLFFLVAILFSIVSSIITVIGPG